MPSHADHASDAMTLLEIIRTLEQAGYAAQLTADKSGGVRCLVCRQLSPASDVQADRFCRAEGASDPADMVAVAAVQCPRCGAKGTIALKYGPGATPEESDILAHLDDGELRHRTGSGS